MSTDAPLERSRYARERERELYDVVTNGDLDAGPRRIALLRRALPVVSLPTNVAIKRDGQEWKRYHLPIDADLLLGHCRGDYALGGIHLGRTQVFVVDMDRHGPRDERGWQLCRELANRLMPHGVWFRSSLSGGQHRWAWLDKPIAINHLAELAADRVRAIARQMPELLEIHPEFRVFGPAGIDGIFEIHPRAADETSGGATLRAPFGQGSALITDTGRYESRPAEAFALLEAHLARFGPSRLCDLFRGRVLTQLALHSMPPCEIVDVGPGRSRTRTALAATSRRRKHGLDPYSGDLAALVDWLSPPGCTRLQADHHTYRVVMDRIRVEPPPPRRRHRTTFLLALSYRWDHLSLDEALTAGERWLRDVASRSSREAVDSWRSALRKTKSIIRRVYRAGAPKPRRRHYARAVALRQRDIAQLLSLLPPVRGLVALAVRVLGFALANGTRDAETGSLLCELPMRLLNIRSRKALRNLALLEQHGILRRIRGTVIHRIGPNEWRSLPALYAIQWSFADAGRIVSRNDFAALQHFDPANAAAGTVGVWGGGDQEKTQGVLRRDEVPSLDLVKVRPVGGVGGRRSPEGRHDARPSKGLVGAPSLARPQARHRPWAQLPVFEPKGGGRGGRERRAGNGLWETIGLSDGRSAVLPPDRVSARHRRAHRPRIRHALASSDDEDGDDH